MTDYYFKCICVKDVSWKCYTNVLIHFKEGEIYDVSQGFNSNYYITHIRNNHIITGNFSPDIFNDCFKNTRDYNLDILIND